MNSILQTKNIHKNYSGHCALDDVSINIPTKSIYGLLGPNGAGKTSLIRIMTQITMPDKGEVFFDGEKLTAKHAKLTGYLPEERGLYKKMQVEEQLVYLAQLKGLSYKKALAQVRQWLEKLDLVRWSKHSVEDLSKGMQQKVQFIAAVIHQPKLIILDEPFTGFDPINAELVKNEILQLRDQGSTIILSTHRMESVEELCDHITLINKSKKIVDGSIEEIKKRFSEHVYRIEGKGLLLSDKDIHILKEENLGEYKSYKVKCESLNENELLQRAMVSLSIRSFKEEIPTIQEIFLSLVKQKSHE